MLNQQPLLTLKGSDGGDAKASSQANGTSLHSREEVLG